MNELKGNDYSGFSMIIYLKTNGVAGDLDPQLKHKEMLDCVFFGRITTQLKHKVIIWKGNDYSRFSMIIPCMHQWN